MDTNNELIQAIGQMMDSKLAAALEPINTRLNTMQSDIEQIKEDTRITRETVNALAEWTDEASGVIEVKFPIKRNQA